jgi:hypothetical protein
MEFNFLNLNQDYRIAITSKLYRILFSSSKNIKNNN